MYRCSACVHVSVSNRVRARIHVRGSMYMRVLDLVITDTVKIQALVTRPVISQATSIH